MHHSLDTAPTSLLEEQSIERFTNIQTEVLQVPQSTDLQFNLTYPQRVKDTQVGRTGCRYHCSTDTVEEAIAQ
jgi:hypothetical protein